MKTIPLDIPAPRAMNGARIRHMNMPYDAIDPFIMVDWFEMWDATFPPHPHAGFSAVTYLFDDSATGFRNRDSKGTTNLIAPGDLHWTLAGRGVMHEEVPMVQGTPATGLQIFVNLPASHKMMPPQAIHANAGAMPRIKLGAATAKLVFGSYDGHESATRADDGTAVPGDATLMDVTIPAGANATLSLKPNQRAMLLVLRGEVSVGDVIVKAGSGVRISEFVQAVIGASAEDAQLAVLLGTPYSEPIVSHGPFAMSTQAQIVDAITRFHAGDMGRLEPKPIGA
jgi:redox-sensitive bicupin YhaK (pirin superfamily)